MADQDQDEGKSQGRQITLCVFPHLTQVLAIDARPDTPNIIELNVSDILNPEFVGEIRESLDQILNPGNMVLADLESIPQQVEVSIKFNVIRRIIDMIEDESEHGIREGVLGVLFFSGDILNISPRKWQQQLIEIVGERLEQSDQAYLLGKLEAMVDMERRAQQGKEVEGGFTIKGLLNGTQKGYTTLWEHSQN